MSEGVQKHDDEGDFGCDRCVPDGRRIAIGIDVAFSSGIDRSGLAGAAAVESKKGSESSSCSVERSLGSNWSMRRRNSLRGTASSSFMPYLSLSTSTRAERGLVKRHDQARTDSRQKFSFEVLIVRSSRLSTFMNLVAFEAPSK